MLELIVALFVQGCILLAILCYVLVWPEKVERIAGWVWKGFVKLGIFGQFARRRFTQHSIQGTVNDFVRTNLRDIPGLESAGVRVEWVDSKETSREAFIRDGKVVVRVRQNDPHDENIANAIYFYVSTALLPEVKRYLSDSQANATDLYFTRRVLQGYSKNVVAHFITNHLHPGLDEGAKRTRELFDTFERIDKAGLFFPVYLREIGNVGRKVYGGPKKSEIYEEVGALIRFLDGVATRPVGSRHVPLEYTGKYCRVAIVIAGREQLITRKISPYIKFIDGLRTQKIETVYVFGSDRYTEQIRSVSAALRENWTETHCGRFTSNYYLRGVMVEGRSYMVVLESKSADTVTRSPEMLTEVPDSRRVSEVKDDATGF